MNTHIINTNGSHHERFEIFKASAEKDVYMYIGCVEPTLHANAKS